MQSPKKIRKTLETIQIFSESEKSFPNSHVITPINKKSLQMSELKLDLSKLNNNDDNLYSSRT